MVSKTGNGQSSRVLTMCDSGEEISRDGSGISVAMHMLPPRPISVRELERGQKVGRTVTKEDILWVIPLVDIRYFWQFKTTGDLRAGLGSVGLLTWEALYDNLATALGIRLEIEKGPSGLPYINPAYKVPNREWFDRQYDNAALMLDAVAHSVGQRIVYGWQDGDFIDEAQVNFVSGELTFRTVSWSTSRNMLAANDARMERAFRLDEFVASYGAGVVPDFGVSVVPGVDGYLPCNPSSDAQDPRKGSLDVAGDEFSEESRASVIPDEILVTFPKLGYGGFQDDAPYTAAAYASTLFGGTLAYKDGTTKVIHSKYPADFSTGSIANLSDIQSLTEWIARDYCHWHAHHYDMVFAGIRWWVETGYCDHVEYTLGRQLPDGSFEGKTRVQSLPYNFGTEDQLSGESTITEYGKACEAGFWAKLTDRVNKEYTWVEQQKNANGQFSNLSGGRSGTAGGTNAAFEVNQTEDAFDHDYSLGSIVWMRVGKDDEYLFDLPDHGFWAKITARVNKEYTWIEQVKEENGQFGDGGRSGTAGSKDAAFEVNGSEWGSDHDWSDRSLIVRMRLGWDNEYLFELPDHGFYAKITARSGKQYSWVEMEPGSSGTFTVVTNGRTGTAGGLNAAFEINESQANFDDANNQSAPPLIVWMQLGHDDAYLFDRGLTNESLATQDDIAATGDTWDVNAQASNEAGVTVLDFLSANGDKIAAGYDSHGQLTSLSRTEDESNTCGSTGPFTGTQIIVESINSIVINADCTITINATRKSLCYHNGILQTVTSVS